jgi:pimeloyl-ACP methyl ester carboxylesterase
MTRQTIEDASAAGTRGARVRRWNRHERLAIDTVESVVLGNVTQWISVRGNDDSAPLMLFLHGGPGTAQIMFTRRPQRDLERSFIVVNWDQRGAGKSYDKHINVADMTIERFVLDAEELVAELLARFGRKKLFLVGHSWGSILGLKVTEKRPEVIHAYIGMGQVVHMIRGEQISYRFTLEEARKRGRRKAVRQLESIGVPPYKDLASAGIQRKWLYKFNGATFEGTTYGTLLCNLSLRDTSIGDIVRFIRGAMFSLKCLEEQQMKIDFLSEPPELRVPVYFCCGRRDYNVPFELVLEFYEKLNAPHKEIVWFEKSGHLPGFEEPGEFSRFCSRMRAEVL